MEHSKKNISVIILAAGESRRMGRPKLLLPIKGYLIIEHTVNAFSCSIVNEIIVVLGSNHEEIIKATSDKPVKVVVNNDYRNGMSTSIKAGILAAGKEAQGFMIALGDQPFLDCIIINSIINAFISGEKGIVVPYHESRSGHPVIFSSRYREEILSLRGDVGGKEIIDAHLDDVLKFEVASNAINNDIDTQADYLLNLK
jgi:molybdenum cofactor cytidylyltransferase